MNPMLGWLLAAVLLVLGWMEYGWGGVAMAVTATVFWLLLQFNRAMRVMKNAADAPMGSVKSAVMLSTRLRARMPMLQVVTLTKSLGQRVSESPEVWRWTDAGGVSVDVTLEAGRVVGWKLQRPEDEAGDAVHAPAPTPPAE